MIRTENDLFHVLGIKALSMVKFVHNTCTGNFLSTRQLATDPSKAVILM